MSTDLRPAVSLADLKNSMFDRRPLPMSEAIDPTITPRKLLLWISGLRRPQIEGQVKLANCLGISLGDLRAQLGLDSNPFSIWLIEQIITRGTICDFCQKTGILRSTIDKWLHGDSVPTGKTRQAPLVKALAVWEENNTPKRRRFLRKSIGDLVALSKNFTQKI